MTLSITATMRLLFRWRSKRRKFIKLLENVFLTGSSSHNKEEDDSEIQIDVSDDEGRTEKKKKRKHKKEKKEKKHKKDKKHKKEKSKKKSRSKKQDGSDVVDETSQDPENFLETLKVRL